MLDKSDSDVDSDDFGDSFRELLTLPDTHICDVWASNFEEEMKKLSKMTQRFNVIAMVALHPFRTLSFQASTSVAHRLADSDQRRRLSIL